VGRGSNDGRMTVSQILRRVVVCLAIAVGLVWVGLRLADYVDYVGSRTMTRAARPKFATSKDILAHSLGGTLWVDSAKVYEDQQIRVDLNLENHTGKTVTLQSVEIQTQGFEHSGGCWQPPNRPACVGDGDSAGVVPATLSPGASLHLHATLKPQSSGRRGLLAIYRWSESAADGKKTTETFTRGVNLEPIEVTTRWEEVGVGFASYADKLALPLVLAIGGALWGWFTSVREHRRDEQAKARETAFQVSKEQWARIFDYTQQYYLRISLSIRGLSDAVTKPQEDRIFYYFLMYWFHKTNLSNKAGWVFSNKDGEDLVGTAQAVLNVLIESKVDKLVLDELVDCLDGPVSLPQFRTCYARQVFPRGPFKQAEEAVLKWYRTDRATFDQALDLLRMMRTVMRFEWDRPFVEHWYGRKPDWNAVKFAGLQTSIAGIRPESEDLTTLKKLAKDYARGVDKYLKIPNARA
jgi:hypothetical protein